eukprot:460139_1
MGNDICKKNKKQSKDCNNPVLVNKSTKITKEERDEKISDDNKIDMNLFSKYTQKCAHKKPIIKNCSYLQRIITVLNYYSPAEVQKDESKLILFCNEKYKRILDDYIHLVMEHNDDLQQINSTLEKCDINKCLSCSRHDIERHDRKDDSKNDLIANFYVDIYDSIHYYLLHLFDVGLRSRMNLIKYGGVSDNEIFSELKNEINKKNKQFSSSSRFKNNDKFNIKLNDNNYKINDLKPHNDSSNNENATETTFIDTMVDYIKKHKIKSTITQKLKQFMVENGFDSDAMENDVEDEKLSNIAAHISDNNCIQLIKQYILNAKFSSAAFSIGIIFYYWNYYKHISETEAQKILSNKNNMNDHSGIEIRKLYVDQKYSSFKQEILEYDSKFVTIKDFQENLMPKVEKYMDTIQAKKLRAADLDKHDLHYDIKPGTKLLKANVLSVKLYTDYTDLCTHFSSSFRQVHRSESLLSIKKRNQIYWWLSKILRETAQYYGDNKVSRRKTYGPFFCGMSLVMVLSEFNIRLCSPVSTSKQKEVALRFAGESGILMTLNNNGDYYSALYLRSFNCAWISQFKEEDERLFIGGDWRIRVQSITVISLVEIESFPEFFEVFYLFDCMINGSDTKKLEKNKVINIKSQYKNVISGLMDNNLGLETEKQFHKYVCDTFNVFLIKKTHIIVNLSYLNDYFQTLAELIIDPLQPNEYETTNKFNTLFFKLFKNIEHIIIYTDCKYQCDLMSFISFMESINNNMNNLSIMIRA